VCGQWRAAPASGWLPCGRCRGGGAHLLADADELLQQRGGVRRGLRRRAAALQQRQQLLHAVLLRRGGRCLLAGQQRQQAGDAGGGRGWPAGQRQQLLQRRCCRCRRVGRGGRCAALIGQQLAQLLLEAGACRGRRGRCQQAGDLGDGLEQVQRRGGPGLGRLAALGGGRGGAGVADQRGQHLEGLHLLLHLALCGGEEGVREGGELLQPARRAGRQRAGQQQRARWGGRRRAALPAMTSA
jgi:hypothetical protein